MADDLHSLLVCWSEWAATTDRSEDGWESFFPHWPRLMRAAQASMAAFDHTIGTLADLERAWSLSEETEDLLEFAKLHTSDCWSVVTALAKSKDARVRWQIYDVAGSINPEGKAILWRGLEDSDAYCRRRALLAFGRPDSATLASIVQKLADDPDPTIQRIIESMGE